MNEFNEYAQTIEFNDFVLTKIVISQHYKEKHSDITDELILSMLELISGATVDPEDEADEEGFQYFKIDPLEFLDHHYRLILLTSQTDDFLGVVNAFRVEKKK